MADEIVTPGHLLLMASANFIGVVTTIVHTKWNSRKRKSRRDTGEHSAPERRKEDELLRELRQIVIGTDGTNGLRSIIHGNRDGIEALEHRMDRLEKRLLQFSTAVAPDKAHLFDFDD